MTDFEKDLAFGLQNETELIDILSSTFNVNLTKTSKYASIDFRSSTLDIELKSRTNAHNAYATTIIPKSKIDYVKRNPGKRYIFAFNFTDGVYYIEYSDKIFSSFECKMFVRKQRSGYNDKEQLYYFIPTEKLNLLVK